MYHKFETTVDGRRLDVFYDARCDMIRAVDLGTSIELDYDELPSAQWDFFWSRIVQDNPQISHQWAGGF